MKPRILVPFDFSAAAESALAWAADLQTTTGAGPIQIVHAINSRPVGTVEASLESLLPNEDEIAELERKDGGGRQRAWRAGSGEGGHQALSEVGDIILDAARADGAELIVMGTHGRTGIGRLLLGSVAEHVLRHADCPVVTVHAPRDR